MPAPSPTAIAGTTISFDITSNGQALDDTIQILSIDVWTGVNKIQKARLIVADGDRAASGDSAVDFPVSAGEALIPGAELAISLGYDGDNHAIFKGKIFRHSLSVASNVASRLIVEAADAAVVMTLSRRNAVHANVTDSEIWKKLISDAGLTAKVKDTSTTHPVIVQYDASDWDMMLMRAQANGFVAIAAGGTVEITTPDISADAVLSLVADDAIVEFHAGMDATTQVKAASITSVAWDPANAAVAKGGQAQAPQNPLGNLGSDQLAAVYDAAVLRQSSASLPKGELTQWSSAQLQMSRLAKIRGEATMQGNALAVVGAVVELGGLGSRFGGKAYVSGVHHRVAEGLWRTTVEIGLSPQWFAAVGAPVASPAAAGLLPPIAALQIGLVKAIEPDPAGEYRVQISLPLLEVDTPVWARLGSFYASSAFGAQFYPEIGDEVILGFMNDDPRFPVILGSLYSKKNKPPNTPASKNPQKSIVTRSKLRVDFFEEDKAIEVSTPGGRKCRLDDGAAAITLEDKFGNKIAMTASGISLTSKGEIKLQAQTITASANMVVSVSGEASVSVKSSGPVDVKGIMVNLNP